MLPLEHLPKCLTYRNAVVHFFGGEFGITMHKPSPSWPFLLIDSSFEGQRKAAIETEEGGLTIIRNQFKNLPTAIAIRENATTIRRMFGRPR